MSFPTYLEYKSSGDQWAPKIPNHWMIAKLKWLSKRFSGGTPDKSKEEFWEDGSVPWLNSGAVNDPYINTPTTYITEAAFNSSSAKWIPKMSLVIALAGQGKTKGMVAQLGIDTTCNQSMAAIIPHKEIEPRYLYWWLTNNYQNIRNMAGGDLRDGLNLELIGDIPCPVPHHLEQKIITAFLDHETAKIDALIAEQEKLIELLKEKRQAIISHAVTKGLDPKVKMKDSGVEWLGQVPEHWAIIRLKHATKLVSDKTSDRSNPIALENIESWSGRFLRSSGDYQGDGIAFRPGDILFGKLRPYLAKVYLTDDDGAAVGDFLVLRPLSGASGKFIQYWMLTASFIDVVNGATFGSKMPRASWDFVGMTEFALPTASEQSQIVGFLDCETAKIDVLLVEQNKAISLLQERRSALISAAVTGQIDVRNFVPEAVPA